MIGVFELLDSFAFFSALEELKLLLEGVKTISSSERSSIFEEYILEDGVFCEEGVDEGMVDFVVFPLFDPLRIHFNEVFLFEFCVDSILLSAFSVIPPGTNLFSGSPNPRKPSTRLSDALAIDFYKIQELH